MLFRRPICGLYIRLCKRNPQPMPESLLLASLTTIHIQFQQVKVLSMHRAAVATVSTCGCCMLASYIGHSICFRATLKRLGEPGDEAIGIVA